MSGESASPGARGGPLLTLEPLLETVRDTILDGGWVLSGLQKTTSYEYEGRWAGESTRSAYLFFHRDGANEDGSLDVFLDETSKGLTGNLALVLAGLPLGEVGDVEDTVDRLARIAGGWVPDGLTAPLTLRIRLSSADVPAEQAEIEYRFKVMMPRTAISGGERTVAAVVRSVLEAFRGIEAHDELGALLPPE